MEKKKSLLIIYEQVIQDWFVCKNKIIAEVKSAETLNNIHIT